MIALSGTFKARESCDQTKSVFILYSQGENTLGSTPCETRPKGSATAFLLARTTSRTDIMFIEAEPRSPGAHIFAADDVWMVAERYRRQSCPREILVAVGRHHHRIVCERAKVDGQRAHSKITGKLRARSTRARPSASRPAYA